MKAARTISSKCKLSTHPSTSDYAYADVSIGVMDIEASKMLKDGGEKQE
jgi:hypothetical protein